MKKFLCAVCVLCSTAFFLNAEQDNGKLFPSREHYSIENIFYGLSGFFDFPNTFYNENLSAMTGVGGGFSAELGYNWSGWMLSAEYLYEAFATKNAAFVRLEKSRNNIFQLRVRRVLSNKTINKFPEWFSLVPGFGAGMNFMQGDYYATQADKDSGNYKSINFHDKEGHSAIIRFSVEAAFDIFKHSEFIPFIGLDYNLIFNERIAGGISGYPRVALGFRRYPFKNPERLRRFKKLLEYDQIIVTEIPPREPHLNAIDDGSRVFNVHPGDEYDGKINVNQRSEDEMLLWDDEKASDNIGDDNNENEDVYNDDKDKKEDYYLPKDENDKDNEIDNNVSDNMDDAVDDGKDAISVVEMPTIKVSPSISSGFTPDGDGVNDTIDFMFEATGLEYQPKSWTVQVVDDTGKVVRTWKGTRKIPEKITWDGMSDSKKLVDSEKVYSVIVSAVPDARDTSRTGSKAVTDTGSFRTGKMAVADKGGKTEDKSPTVVETPPVVEMPTIKVSSSISSGFTPDGDGVNDTIDFMFEATGLEHQPKSWTVQVVDDTGKVVRTWKGTRKIPEKITWDGMSDSKKLVDAEKEYSVIVSAVPDARDTSRTGSKAVTDTVSFRTGKMAVADKGGKTEDKTPPVVEMPTIKVSSSISSGFTPDGDGVNDTIDFMFEATGLEYQPKSWTVQVVDDTGKVVRTWKGTRKIPEKITWDGMSDSKKLVDAEKEYSVIVSAVPDARDTSRTGSKAVTDTGSFRTGKMAVADKGGKIEDKTPTVVEMPTIKVSSSISDVFTPDGDGIDDTVDFMFEVTGLEYQPKSWTVQVVDDTGKVVRTWKGTRKIPEKITWDGMSDSKKLVDAEKEYSVIVSAVPDARDTSRTGSKAVTDTGSFRTGKMAVADKGGKTEDKTPTVVETPPVVEMPTIKVSSSISDGFTPDGDGVNDTIDFMFEATGLEYQPKSWTVQVVDDTGKVVRTWKGTRKIPEKITWDGMSDSKKLIDAEKEYSVIVSAVPDARDTSRTGSKAVTDTGSFRTGKMAVADKGGKTEDKTPTVVETPPVVEMPTIKVSSSISSGFTPDGDGVNDTIDFMFEATGLEYPPESWTVQVVDDAGNVVKSWSDTGDNVPEKITWDGVTDSGNLVDAEKEYSIIISVVPDARDKARTAIDTVTDTGSFRTGSLNEINVPVARLLMSYSDGLSPDGDGNKDDVEFTFKTDGLQHAPESWKLEIFDPAGNIIRTWSGNGELPESITWDGTSDDGNIVAALSSYPVILSVTPDARDAGKTDTLVDRQVLRTGIITIAEPETQPEKLAEESLTTEEQPSEDEAKQNEPETEKPETPVEEVKEPVEEEQPVDNNTDTTTPVSDEEPETKDNADAPTDEQPSEDEQTEPETEKPETPIEEVKEPVEEEPELKEDAEKEPEEKNEQITTRKRWRLISVPVYFDPDTATFDLISEENRQSNIRVLNKIAAEIRKYGDTATVVVEGHANNVSNTEQEHFEELIPLSLERAEVVRQLLIERGIEADRLTAEGVGGLQPQSPWADRRNWWKNRRVEFIISTEE